MSKTFKPHRGKANIMSTTKANMVLAAGELFAEVPNTGAGTGKGRLVMGDGLTAYSNLPSFIENTDVSTAQVTITTDNSETSDDALNNIVTNATTGELIGSLKQALTLTKSEIDDKIKVDNQYFYFDYQNGEYGYNTSSSRGADTFHPFNTGGGGITIDNFIPEVKTGGAVDGGSWDDPGLRTYAAGFTISKTYDSVNKQYSISGNTQRISCGGRSAVQTVPINTYVINGNATNLGKITTYDASNIPGYQNLTTQNFIVEIFSAPYTYTGAAGDDEAMYARASGFPLSKSYNTETGIFTVSGLSQVIGAGGRFSTSQAIDYTVWLAKEVTVIIG